MSLVDNSTGNGMIMPVSPMYGGGYGGGFGGFGGDGWWVILFLFALMGNWGGFDGGFGGGNDAVLPYMWNTQTQNDVNRGFDTAGITSQLSGIQTSLTNGFANAEVSGCNRAMDAMQTAYNNQIASMNQRFADSQALSGHLNDISMGLQNCCCENRAAVADLKYTVATENCADRTQSLMNTRDIIDSQTRGTQAIIDKLCQLELDGVKNQLAQAQRENVGLQNQINMATMRESQTAQNALITQGFANEVDALYNRLNTCPVPTTPVYGRTPIFTCNNNSGCGCGYGGFNGNF